MSEQIEKGQRVRITFEGEVEDIRGRWVRFRDADGNVCATVLSWDQNLSPSVEILAPVFRSGDVGVYTNPRGRKFSVVFHPEGGEHGAGWYHRVDASTTQKLASPNNLKVVLVLRADGSLVEQPVPEPEETGYTPKAGDVALWQWTNGERFTVQYRMVAGSYGWYDCHGASLEVNPASDRFALVISGGELVELVEGAGI